MRNIQHRFAHVYLYWELMYFYFFYSQQFCRGSVRRWWNALNGYVEIDLIISLPTFLREQSKEGGGGRNIPRFCVCIDRGSLILVKQWRALPRLNKKNHTFGENSSWPESCGRRPISRLDQLFHRRSSASIVVTIIRARLCLFCIRSRAHTSAQACTQKDIYPVCWRCVCFIGNFWNCVRDA